jgi:hypothetical protein
MTGIQSDSYPRQTDGMTDIDLPGPRRRRFSIRLPHWGWFLLAMIALAAVVIDVEIWLPYVRERQVIREIVAAGALVAVEPAAPEWLIKRLGEDRVRKLRAFDRVVYVNFEGVAVTDADVAHLSNLSHIKYLFLNGESVTDASLVHLKRLTKLTELHLVDTAVTDAGMIRLSEFTELRNLSLQGTKVTDAGMLYVRNLPNLEVLHIERTAVTNEGVRFVRFALPDCRIRF